MKVSKFIKILEEKCADSDPEIQFMAYRWSDDLEEKDYYDAWFADLKKKKNIIKVYIDT